MTRIIHHGEQERKHGKRARTLPTGRVQPLLMLNRHRLSACADMPTGL